MAARYAFSRADITALQRKTLKLPEQELLAVVHRKVKSGKPAEQIAKWVEARQAPIHRLSRAYFSRTAGLIGNQLEVGFPFKSREQLYRHEEKIFAKFKPININAQKVEKGLVIESGRKATSTWHPLPLRYIAMHGRRSKTPGLMFEPYGKWQGLPKRRTFWHKTGTLAEEYRRWLTSTALHAQPLSLYGYEGINAIARSLREVEGVRLNKRQVTKMEVALRLRFPDLGSPALNTIIRQSFVTTRPALFRIYQRDGAGVKGGAPKDETRLAYPEYGRPWVARFAALMGRRHRAGIKAAMKRM